ncbi:MAG: glutathione S-transferase [Propionivibrio sp.]
MQLIGMLDSPYVRRVAISLQLLGLRFEHQPVSVFREFDRFQAINPVVKAPTLICDDGRILMDSTLILDYAEALADADRTLRPAAIDEFGRMLQLVGLALAVCEKSVQIVYERTLRPTEKQHEPWLNRVSGQLLAACDVLETELKNRPLAASSTTINQAGISIAVAWQFAQQMVPDVVPAVNYPALRVFSTKTEALQAFAAAPHGPGIYQAQTAG